MSQKPEVLQQVVKTQCKSIEMILAMLLLMLMSISGIKRRLLLVWTGSEAL